MNWQQLLAKRGITGLKINLGVLQTEWNAKDEDKKAAWEMYIELLTRITTQPLAPSSGDENSALDSVYSLFPTTRNILKSNGPGCIEFSKIAIIVLNQVVRPFTAKWHPISLKDGFDDDKTARKFRRELKNCNQRCINTAGFWRIWQGLRI